MNQNIKYHGFAKYLAFVNDPRCLFLIFLAILIFIIDHSLHLGIAGAILYIPVVLLSSWSNKRLQVIGIASFCSVLAILGMYLSPEGGDYWKEVAKITVAISAMWLTALIAIKRMVYEQELRDLNTKLESEIAERTTGGVQLRLRTEELESKIEESQWLEGELAALNASLVTKEAERAHIYREASIGLCYLDTDFRYLHINNYLAACNGLTVEEHLGKTIRKLFPDIADGAEPGLRKVIETGEPVIKGEIFAETRAHPGEKRYYEHSYYANKSNDGKVLGVSCIVEDVTERKITEKDLRASELRYRLLFDNANDGATVFSIGKDGKPSKFSEVNDSTCEMLGYSRQEILQMTPPEIGEPKFTDGFKKRIEQLLNSGHLLVEGAFMHKDGHPVPVELSAHLFDLQSQPTILVLTRDITERKKAEYALRESEERFRQLTENIDGVFWLSEPDLETIHYVSPAYERIWGRTCESLYRNPKSWLDCVHEEDRIRVVDEYKRKIETGFTDYASIEYRIITCDGSIRWISSRSFRVFDEKRQFMRVAAIAQDITEQRESEAALKESEERFRQFADHVEDVLWVMSLDRKKVFYVSPAYERLMGRKIEDFYRDPSSYLEGIHPDDREAAKNRFTAKSTEFSNELRIVRPDGSTRWALSRVFPIKDANGQIYRLSGIVTDITDSVKARNQDTNHKVQLMRADRLKNVGRLAAGVAHEINNPLSVLYGMLQELEMSPSSLDAEDVSRMLKVTRRIRTIVGNLLVFSKQLPTEKVPSDIRALIENALTLVSTKLDQQRISLDLNLEANLPLIAICEDQIEQVFLNLIFNAVDAMPDGGTLSISTAKHDGDAVIRFSDTGTGMASEEMDKIFLPFYTTKDVDQGTGLGLSISYEIITDHSGEIKVESTLGKGSSFDVILPI